MRTILIVDDDPVMLTLARRILEPKYKTVTASNGEEAIKVFERTKPDLILSDLRMPKMDGYELHRILQEKSSEHVPVIFMTADESNESEQKGFAIGAADYIRKPWHPNVLLRRVGNIVDNLDKIHGLKTAASTDPMTGLLNKTASQKQIGELAEKSPGALMMIDLDSFKLVNDIYGHSMGDGILISLVELIKKIINEDDLAGRMGGDEFIVYLKNVRDEAILQERTIFLNEELVLFAKQFLGEDMEIPLGVSVGAVFAPDEGTNFHELYKKADSALYEVKKNGKHGLSVYGVKKKKTESVVVNQAEQLSQMIMILGERNIGDLVYFVDFESFKTIYRLLVRIANNYKLGLQLLQFVIKSENFSADFKAELFKSLRNSDCITQSGNKVLVIVTGTTSTEAEDFKNKIFSQLENFSDKVIFESEKIF